MFVPCLERKPIDVVVLGTPAFHGGRCINRGVVWNPQFVVEAAILLRTWSTLGRYIHPDVVHVTQRRARRFASL